MNNFGRAVLAVGLSAVMTFTGPEYFFQSGVEPVSVYAAEEKAVQSKTAGDNSAEGESTTEVTTEKKEESTTATESQESQTSSERDTSSGNTEHSQTEHTTESTKRNTSGTSGNTDQAEDTDSSTSDTSGNSSHSNEEGTTQKKAKKDISSREDAEIRTKAIKKITDQLAEEDAPDGSDKTSTFIPKIYNDTRLAMKNNKEYIAGYVYFNQTDSAWNQNGYCIAKAGCGPTSMAVVITSLTGKWVTPLDTAIWGYQHGFYSRAGSAHEMIPAMAAAYGLKCQGSGTDYNAIKKALKEGKPVVCLMGPGYFTRGGHFMVLVSIDKNDCVTVADVGSRVRSAYKYRLSDVIAQSKGASAGGPFWIMSYDKESKSALQEKQAIKDYTEEDMAEDFADVSYMKVKGNLPEVLQEEKADVSMKKVVSILKMSTGKSLLDTIGAGKGTALAGTSNAGSSVLSPVSQNSQVIVVNTDASNKKAGSQSGSTALAGSAADTVSQGQSAKRSQNLALTLKQDIARRQWEKKIDLSWMDNYMQGTLEK